MIVGNGMIAKACKPINRDDIVIFASGVSDSNESRQMVFAREENLLDSFLNDNKTIIYFGTKISNKNPYFIHKGKMCDKIKTKNKYIILRLSQVVGHGGNMKNFFNNIFISLIKVEKIKAYPVERAIIDIDDVIIVLKHLIDNNLYGEHKFFKIESMAAIDIINIIAKYMGIKPNIVKISGVMEKIPDNSDVINKLIYPLKKNYTERVIKKYIL